MPVSGGLGENRHIRLQPIFEMGASQPQPPADGDLVHDQTGSAAGGQFTNLFQKTGIGIEVARRLHDDGGQIRAVPVHDGPEFLDPVVGEGHGGAGESAGHSGRFQSRHQVPASQPVHRLLAGVHRNVGGQIPVVPTVVAAEGHLVPSGIGPGDPHRDGHAFSTEAPEPDHLSPRVELQHQLGQFHLVGRIQGRHAAIADPPDHRFGDIGIGIAQERGADAAHGHVDVVISVRVHRLTAPGLSEIGWPLPRSGHLLALAVKLRRAWDELPGPVVHLLTQDSFISFFVNYLQLTIS